ncbi:MULTISPECIES: M50 family metallopeptidase [Actinopolyspora]|uniref:Membrane-associated protease RseP, regulator of RpoE activity n=1 Tax=Actinopolyspora saharensis TaxID=995062 RepID=A0A1H1D0L6_9ACTN|nr:MULTISPECIES: site-2 protease family protein [Actinopolyspora]NHD17228.1 site-2 protease family protein [Actinopolyspora sp. BKK2]NHE76380.1 site-2 protease family protein [Actinopolyspora sp. BKK1]SDQ70004.1 Membrane-associated protease RseP, regulator of RpoE activity [Actinopolyspora saharensis]
MLVVLGILIFFLGLLFSIAWHELGHLTTAKMFGVKVTQYMVGFGRTIFSRKKGETEYGVKAVPFGGFIRMIGMFPPQKEQEYGRTASSAPWRAMVEDARQAVAEEVRPEDSHRQFYQRKPWKRIIVMAAGPFMNLILAVGIFTTVLMAYGVAQPTTTVSSVSECVVSAKAQNVSECPEGAPKSPAAQAGFRPDDEIVSFNGERVESWQELRGSIRNSTGTATVVVERDGRTLTLHPDLIPNTQPKINDSDEYVEVGFLGITPTQHLVRQSFGDVVTRIGSMIGMTAQKVVELPSKVPDLVAAIGGQERESDSPVGVVGASRLGGEVLSYDELSVGARMITMVQLLAGVNLSLFLINMLPILPLDGGHIAGALWESLRRKLARLVRRPDPGPFDTAKLMPVAYVVSLVFIAYSLLVLVADIVNPVTLT